MLTVCGLLSILVALGGAKVAADSLSPVVAEAITPRITTTVEDRLEKNVNQSMKDAGETAKDSLSGILSIFGNSETYEKASEQLQKAIQSGLKPSLESAAKSVAKDLAQPVAWWAVYGIAFCLILLVWELVSKLLNLVAKLPVLNLANRIMGGGIGLLKGVLVVGPGLLGHPPLGAGDGGRDPGERVFAVFFKFFLGERIVPSRKTRFIHICMI